MLIDTRVRVQSILDISSHSCVHFGFVLHVFSIFFRFPSFFLSLFSMFSFSHSIFLVMSIFFVISPPSFFSFFFWGIFSCIIFLVLLLGIFLFAHLFSLLEFLALHFFSPFWGIVLFSIILHSYFPVFSIFLSLFLGFSCSLHSSSHQFF